MFVLCEKMTDNETFFRQVKNWGGEAVDSVLHAPRPYVC